MSERSFVESVETKEEAFRLEKEYVLKGWDVRVEMTSPTAYRLPDAYERGLTTVYSLLVDCTERHTKKV